jgi:hypothetical protein
MIQVFSWNSIVKNGKVHDRKKNRNEPGGLSCNNPLFNGMEIVPKCVSKSDFRKIVDKTPRIITVVTRAPAWFA